MNRVRIALLAAVVFTAASATRADSSAQVTGNEKVRLNPNAKPVRDGFIITVEGGIEGRKEVRYTEEELRAAKAARRTPGSEFPVPNDSRPDAPKPVAASAKTPEEPVKNLPIEDIVPTVEEYAKTNDDFLRKRFGLDRVPSISTGDRFDGGELLDEKKWAGQNLRHDTRLSGISVGPDERYSGENIEKTVVTRGRIPREIFARSGEKAAIKNRDEVFSKSINENYSKTEVTSALAERMSAIKTYAQVSMQDINRMNFRRSHSEEKGALPVAKPGVSGARAISGPTIAPGK